ncbi:hypothetical protein ANOM_001320 [Aspergillus nomiae NRRL 13137]|uniref:Uncharacterized protein n=1 Tax=Aspergillus nomiae NRRL (strain ATCC 15546 / NRRL 13137 / CBS 260.88 / M93) TaxID=1509407 RepID=A0A0L1JGU1_ASPN3|nr:uncharacterized protein ANOM_001320 [Aspergillus nomiae NRRL 13137]KNG90618.1 hypothetical protein ANOM_001320 [Aspergillus nomiae NRRL 13137]
MAPRFKLVRLVAGTAITGGSSIALLASYITSDIEFVPLSATDPIFQSKHLQEYNPNSNPTIHDLHIARVPLTQIHPRLLDDPNKLLERYCGGIWAGAGKPHSIIENFSPQQMYLTLGSFHDPGFAPQRIMHTWFDRGESSSPQLWSTSELLQSDYKVGTDIAGNFEVVNRSNESILIRAGDKTSNKGLRPLDALIEVGSHIDRENNVAVFEFKSLFFQGIGTTSNPPMPGPIVWLHELYAKILLKSGVQHVLR